VAEALSPGAIKEEGDYAWAAPAQALAIVARHLDAKDAKAAAIALTGAIRKAKDSGVLENLARGLSAVAARLDAKEAMELCTIAATTLTEAISKATDPSELRAFAQGIATVAACLGRQEAAAACTKAAGALTQAIAKHKRPGRLLGLGTGLSALVTYLEPNELTKVATALTDTINKTSDPDVLEALPQALSAVAARLGPKDSACVKAAEALSDAIAKATDPAALAVLAESLSAVVRHLEVKVAVAHCSKAAATLTLAISKAVRSDALRTLANGLWMVADHLGPMEAKAATAILTEVIRKTTDPHALGALAESLSAVTVRSDAKQTANGYTTVAPILLQALSRRTNSDQSEALALGLSSLAACLDPKTAVMTLTEAIEKTSRPRTLAALAKGLLGVANRLDAAAAAAACNKAAKVLNQALSTDPFALEAVSNELSMVGDPPRCSLSTPNLIDMLKSPLCIRESRRVVLAALGARYKRQFADDWDFVHFADQGKLGLDFTTPPQQPGLAPNMLGD
jgi:hypothetical protein